MSSTALTPGSHGVFPTKKPPITAVNENRGKILKTG
jgi:hypothetical protein